MRVELATMGHENNIISTKDKTKIIEIHHENIEIILITKNKKIKNMLMRPIEIHITRAKFI